MKSKKIAVLMSILFLAVLLAGPVYAKGHSGSCSCKDKGMICKKIEKKAHFMKLYQGELGLTDEQIDEIKDLKMRAKKVKIQKKAEMAVIKVDMKKALYDYPTDAAALGKLVDQKLAVKKSMANDLIGIYAQIRNMLTEEQNDKMKEIWMEKKKKHHS